MKVASYVATFLKPEMLHIYRQIIGLSRWQTCVVTKRRLNEELFPMPPGAVKVLLEARPQFLRRLWLKYVEKEPPIVYRGESGALATLLERQAVDLLHVYFGHTGVHLLPFLKRWPRPSVVSFHGMDVQARESEPSYGMRLRELLQVVTLVLVRSESLRERLLELGCAPDKLRMNRTGIPLAAYPFKERVRPVDGAWHMVQACRLVEKKGLDDTLRAFAAFREVYPAARLTIAGDGPLRVEVERLAIELGVGGGVRLAGFLTGSALCELYHDAHFFVHPSRMTADQNQEGVPNSMLEAMATGLPVVATRHGGIPEAVSHEQCGLLVPERDVDSLFAAMCQMTAKPEQLRVFSEAAARAVRDGFEQSKQIENLERAYDEAQMLKMSPQV
jgi:colanic acid/amylovoran biosynthesis glycosyltransferase